MGTLKEKLNATRLSVNAIAAAINDRGVALDDAVPLSAFSGKIREIRGGGEFYPDGYHIIVNASIAPSAGTLDGMSVTIGGTAYPLKGMTASVSAAARVGQTVSISFSGRAGICPPDDVLYTVTESSYMRVVTAVFAPCAARLDVSLKNTDGTPGVGQTVTVGNVTKTVTGAVMHFPVGAAVMCTATANIQAGSSYPGSMNVLSGAAGSVTAVMLQYKKAVRYGVRVKRTEPNPYLRVEYLYDAIGKAPAGMNYTSGKFEYGGWEPFLKDICRPCMVNYDLTIRGELSPNDHAKYLDGTPSGISDFTTPANAMSVFKKWYLNQYQDEDYDYFIISDIKWDSNYCDYHCYNELGLQDYMMLPMFGASFDGTRLRSIAGKALSGSKTYSAFVSCAKANGAGWNLFSYSKLQFRNALLKIIGKSTDSQAVFGIGSVAANSILPTGTLMSSGMFSGKTTNNEQVKVLWCESVWGDKTQYICGLKGSQNMGYYAKMKPPYSLVGNAGCIGVGNNDADLYGVSSITVTNLVSNDGGCFPLMGTTANAASDNTYECDVSFVSDKGDTLEYGAIATAVSRPGNTGMSALQMWPGADLSPEMNGSISA